MKMKLVVWLYMVMLSLTTILSLYIPKQEAAADEIMVIPDEAIRLRILANSDSNQDQALKRMIRDEVNKQITLWVENLTNIDEARATIQRNLPAIEQIALDVMNEEDVQQALSIDFGEVQFPTKLYGNYLYPAGEYEAILITLGDGQGANWWCVLFPPLCFLDFSSGTAISKGFESNVKASEKEEKIVEEKVETPATIIEKEEPPKIIEDEEPEVKFFIVEWIKGLFA
ncbi:stage II sporulation protein R [Bacillus spongiae]|uniref:Stage II sporulation protein R n=1 Tax=Bacillus spongiae TaxID=2683610 RepID=A0ABU8HIT7_9BACI